MPNVKTTVSLDESLLARIDELAREMQISRNQLLAQAMEEFIWRHEDRRLLASLNAVHGEASTPEEEDLQRQMRRQQRQVVKGEW